ncbi:MAG: hypothetical protein Q7R98_03765 [Candidatus Jorgensenbacteria bacterium]|nr:hypothetical protein [Candidatus Jorgensenbacteria bacterium]
MEELQNFLTRFKFCPEGEMLVGIEREAFLVRSGSIVPIAREVLEMLGMNGRYGYELSACQLEDRVGPIDIAHLLEKLCANEVEIARAEQSLKFQRFVCEVAPDDMPLDVYPDPTGRYQEITKTMPREILLAACQVIGTHVHIGMPDTITALLVYNNVISHWEELCRMGDGSCGRRLEIYKKMAPDFVPPHYPSWEHFYREAVEKGFETDPRKCWHLIRLSVHGTIEFRMFGTTCELERIVTWAKRCHELCRVARETTR